MKHCLHTIVQTYKIVEARQKDIQKFIFKFKTAIIFEFKPRGQMDDTCFAKYCANMPMQWKER